MTYNIIARPPDSIRDRAESGLRDNPRSTSHMMAFDGRILRANDSTVATPRRAMFAIAKTPSFATGVAVRATRSTRARRERCVYATSRSTARDATRVAIARERRETRANARGDRISSDAERRRDKATTRDASVRGTNEGRETRAKIRASDAIGTRCERRRGFGKGVETQSEGRDRDG